MDRGIGSAIYSQGILGLGSGDTNISNIGHIIIDLWGEKCSCGKRGCFETYASIDSIATKIRHIYPNIEGKITQYSLNDNFYRKAWHTTPELLAIRDCYHDLKSNKNIIKYFERLIEAIAVALYNFIYLTNPQKVFYAGRTVEQLDVIFNEAILKTKNEYLPETFEEVDFIKSNINSELLYKGASFLVFNNYLQIVQV
jgi:predicted NBD/HSP70 family sugar kinase